MNKSKENLLGCLQNIENVQKSLDIEIAAIKRLLENEKKTEERASGDWAAEFNKFVDYVGEWAVKWGFWDDKDNPLKFAEKIALCHTELSEALEKHRKTIGKGLPDAPDEHCPEFGGVEIELADTVIRLMDMSANMGFNLGGAIEAKMKFNHTRERKHGKAY